MNNHTFGTYMDEGIFKVIQLLFNVNIVEESLTKTHSNLIKKHVQQIL